MSVNIYEPAANAFLLVIPASHPELEKCLASIKGQIYSHFRAIITNSRLLPNIQLLSAKLALPPDKFIFAPEAEVIKPDSNATIIYFDSGQWLAHAHALTQITGFVKPNASIALITAAMSAPYAPNFLIASQNANIPKNFSFLPDANLACLQATGNEVDLPLTPVRPELDIANKTPSSIALATIITPDYLAEAMLSLSSYKYNCGFDCSLYAFIATEDPHMISMAEKAMPGISILHMESMACQSKNTRIMSKRYAISSNEYRWAMKSVILAELLERGHDFALHLDPDLYTVDDITDLQTSMHENEISLFPHFRDPDLEESRMLLYSDGFFNGGMIGANKKGLSHLKKLTARCQREMAKDRKRNLYCDQKYFEWFIFEVEKLFINRDKGINYTIWNSDPIYGLIGPGQRSYLLKSGYYPRIWHMQADFLKSVCAGNPKLAWARPISVWYLLAKAYLLLLLCIKYQPITALLEKRLPSCLSDIGALAGKDKILPLIILWNQIIKTGQINIGLEFWGKSVLSSPGFDNFGLYAMLLENMFPDEPNASLLCQELRKNDFRYASERPCPTFEYNAINVAKILQNRAELLAEWRFFN